MRKCCFKKTNSALFCVCALAAIILGSQVTANELVNPFLQEGRWYKAALHVHSTMSDGDVDVPTRMKQYREIGYHVVAITDHGKTSNIDGLSDEKFLVLSGMEGHPAGNHLVCLNIPEGFEIRGDMDLQGAINSVNAVGGAVIYAHPYWMGHTIEEMLSAEGYIGVEVFNGVCSFNGYGYGIVHWDQLLVKGRMLPAMAVDDAHNSKHLNLGWTMIKAKELTAKAIIDSLKKGCHYSSCGPTIEYFRVEDGVAKIRCSPVSQIRFAGKAPHGRMYIAQDSEPLTTIEWKMPEGSKYVRAEVIDANGKHAWTNPIVLE